MATGAVKWFNSVKGFGFIAQDAGEGDIFVHKSALEDSKVYDLREGQHVEYSEATDRGKTKAVNIKVID